MSRFESLSGEYKLTLGILILSAFLFVNFSQTVGILTFMFIIVYLVSLSSPKIKSIEIKKATSTYSKIIMGSAILFVIWLSFAYITINYFFPSAAFSIESVFSYIKAKTEIPVLSYDPLIRLIVFGGLIPIAESLFAFSLVLRFWADNLKIPVIWNPRDLRMWYVIAAVGVIMALMHLAVRATTGSIAAIDASLITDALFFSLGAGAVFFTGQMAEAILVHNYINIGVLL